MHKTTHAPMIYIALCIMFWMRAYPLLGEVGGGLGPGIREILGPVKWHRADRRVPFGAQKTRAMKPFHSSPKTLELQGPAPLVMDMHASKTLCTGLYKS